MDHHAVPLEDLVVYHQGNPHDDVSGDADDDDVTDVEDDDEDDDVRVFIFLIIWFNIRFKI